MHELTSASEAKNTEVMKSCCNVVRCSSHLYLPPTPSTNTVHARNRQGQYFAILETDVYEDETTGLAFSPDGKHLLFAYQETGVLYDITRVDGLPFSARTLNVKYHAPSKRH